MLKSNDGYHVLRLFATKIKTKTRPVIIVRNQVILPKIVEIAKPTKRPRPSFKMHSYKPPLMP